MTFPEFTPVVEQSYEKRDPSEFLPWRRCVERKTQSGQFVPGKLLIVRPLEAIEDYRELSDEQKAKKARGEEVWRGKLIVVDVALLDALPYIPDDGMGNELMGFAAGTIFRNNTVKLGYLNKAFREMIGGMCIGTVYAQPPKQTGFQPSIHWRDMANEDAAKARGRSFLQAFPDFLIPVKAQFTPAATPAQNIAVPVSPAPQGNGYQQPDPWSSASAGAPASEWGVQQAAQPVSPAPQHPNAGMNTLEQLKAARNAQGQSQEQDPPF